MILRHVLAILLLPTTVTLVVPYLIVSSRSSEASEWPRWTIQTSGPLAIAVKLFGTALIAAGLVLVAVTVRIFATVGRGTLAPWDPTQRLVVTGVYRYVRNPMITGVLLILLGEAVVFRSVGVLAWAAGFFAVNVTYIPLLEERGLHQRFGEEYAQYCRHVPRWIPRTSPWKRG